MADRPVSPFANLGKSQSDQSAPAVPLEKAVLRGTRDRRLPSRADEPSPTVAERQNGRTAERQQSATTSQGASDGKIGYRISLAAIEAIKDLETELRRKHRIKAPLRRILEEAIFAAYEDLQQSGQASELVKRLSATEERKNTAMEER